MKPSVVRWMGRFEPTHKYLKRKIPLNPIAIDAWSLAGDRPEFREDLRELGATAILYRPDGFYDFKMDRATSFRLAELWSVYKIFWKPQPLRLDDD